MNKISFEEYLKEYHMLTYRNVGVSMLPMLKQGRDTFTVRAVENGETCKRWDVVLYKRPPERYVLHRIIRVYEDGYDILGDNCIGIESHIPKENIIGVLTEFTHKNKSYKISDIQYLLYVILWCKPYRTRIFLKKSWAGFKSIYIRMRKG